MILSATRSTVRGPQQAQTKETGQQGHDQGDGHGRCQEPNGSSTRTLHQPGTPATTKITGSATATPATPTRRPGP